MAVADVESLGVRPDPQREGAAARDDGIVATHREALDGAGEERQQVAEPALAGSEPLQVGGVHLATGEAGGDRVGVVEQRVDRGLGPAGRDLGEGALGPPHHKQVVVG